MTGTLHIIIGGPNGVISEWRYDETIPFYWTKTPGTPEVVSIGVLYTPWWRRPAPGAGMAQ